MYVCVCLCVFVRAQVYNAYQTLLKGLASMLQTFHGIAKGSTVDCSSSPLADSTSGVLAKQQAISVNGSSSGRSSVDRDDGVLSAAGGDPSVNHLCNSSLSLSCLPNRVAFLYTFLLTWWYSSSLASQDSLG